MDSTEWQEIKDIFLTANDMSEQERAAYLSGCGEHVRTKVEKLLRADKNAENFIVEPAIIDAGFVEENELDPFIGGTIDGYKIIREIGRGGMGTVYLAQRSDESFDKTVAIKLVKRGMDTNAVLKRFLVERSILAHLEHPNIASLIDGGTTADGLPYFVMEYVDGMPITKYCNSRASSINERLELFQKVCAAISYAHANLVVHRDVKPSNILVTQDGTPKLLDFGIAKLLHPDWSLDTAEATATMFRILTPEYASPEQIRGLTVTTASDVYSLGVVLYELLTGERPYKIESRLPQEIANMILTEEPIKPSECGVRIAERGIKNKSDVTDENQNLKTDELNNIRDPKSAIRDLKGDLDNIILKALRKEPERRYASVQEFSEDIRRHLVGLPVTAMADTVSYRVGKFVKRHRAGVFAGTLVLLTLIFSTAVTAWQSIVARREQAKAEQRFREVRQLANTVLFEYHDGIAKLPGSTRLREKMVNDALRYLDNLAAENIDDASLQSELATAYFKVGEVQGSPGNSSLGDYGGALESFRKSLTIRESLAASDSNNESIKLDLAQSYQLVGHTSQVTDDLPAAFENYQKAFAVFDSMPREALEAKRSYATLHTRFAKALSSSGDHAKALENCRLATALLNELISLNPENRALKRDLGISLQLLGDELERSVELEEALSVQRQAFIVLEPLRVETDAGSKRDLSSAYGRIGDVLFKLGEYKEALAMQQKVLASSQEILRADPTDARARRDVQVDYYTIARNYSELGRMSEALVSLQKCIDLAAAAVAANPESSEARGDLAVAFYYFGEMHEKNNDLRSAFENYRKATEIEEAMSAADPSNISLLDNLSEDLLKVSDMAMKLGHPADAVAGYLKALSIREKIQADAEEKGESRGVTANIYEGLGDYYLSQARIEGRLENLNEAKKRYEQSLEIWNSLAENGILLTKDTTKPAQMRQKITKCDRALGN